MVDGTISGDPRAARRPSELAEALLVNGVPVSPNDNRSARISSRVDAAHDDAVDRRQPGGGHAHRLWRVDRQTVRYGQRDVRAEEDLDHWCSRSEEHTSEL